MGLCGDMRTSPGDMCQDRETTCGCTCSPVGLDTCTNFDLYDTVFRKISQQYQMHEDSDLASGLYFQTKTSVRKEWGICPLGGHRSSPPRWVGLHVLGALGSGVSCDSGASGVRAA